MKHTGILFMPELAAKVRAREKTMTRRPLRVQPPDWAKVYQPVEGGHEWVEHDRDDDAMRHWPDYYKPLACPYGGPGDLLYHKEPFIIEKRGITLDGKRMSVLGRYTDDDTKFNVVLTEEETEAFAKWKAWYRGKSPFFMFKSMARTWLELTAVRAERINSISEAEALAEGFVSDAVLTVAGDDYTGYYASDRFIRTWERIHGKEPLLRNDWVWVLTYKLTEKPR